MMPRWLTWITLGGVTFVVIVLIAAFLADEPLRRYAERSANEALDGYGIRIGALDLHPLTLSLELGDVVVWQTEHPDPPLADIPKIVIDVALASLLSGKAVVEIDLSDPLFSGTGPQINTALGDTKEKAGSASLWQDKVRDMIPFEADLFIKNGEVRYVGRANDEPVRLTQLEIEIRNLTNHREDAEAYPTELHMRSRPFDNSRLEFNGRANLLTTPLPSVDASAKLSGLRIEDLTPIVGAYNVVMKGGVFSATARVLQSQETVLSLESFVLEGAKIGYVFREETTSKQRRQLERGAEQAAKVHRDPSFEFKVGHGKILNSELGFLNHSTKPDYRIFLSDVNADIDHFSNRLEEGTGVVKVMGKFMGSGPTIVTATFRPEKPRPDFDLAVRIIKTDVTQLNDVLRAYGDTDTHNGKFALFSELKVKNDRIDGYVKPLFQDVDVYNPEKDKDKVLSSKLYKAVIDGVTSLLENRPRNEVATLSDLSGPVENPRASTWQIIEKLVQNAFFKAILPGFEGKA